MTREEILAMKPGRELNALVAEKVLGYKLHWAKPEILGGSGNVGGTLEWVACEPHEHGAQRLREDGRGIDDYSRTGPAVWDVVQHMAEAGWALTLYTGSFGAWWAGFHRGKTRAMTAGDSPAEAICIAALLALEEQSMG